jgi:hypothetical protein
MGNGVQANPVTGTTIQANWIDDLERTCGIKG